MINVDPNIDNSRPTIEGAPFSAQTVLEFLGAGGTIEDLLEAYPSLRRGDVLAWLRYAPRLTGRHFTIEKVS
jgi:uncharacterized protein (DUF433 family)